MEWTGQFYADKPTVAVDIHIDAPPDTVWELVSDIHLMPRLSTELREVQWLDDAAEPAVGRRFAGRNKRAFAEWETVSTVVEADAPNRFAWAVGDPAFPSALWRFSLREDESGGCELEQWVQMGPGPSGITSAIESMPDKEQKIVFVRLREFETGIQTNLAAIKELAERGS